MQTGVAKLQHNCRPTTSVNSVGNLEAELCEHRSDRGQVCRCLGLVLDLLGTLLLNVVRIGLDLALSLKVKIAGARGWWWCCRYESIMPLYR